MKTMKVYPIFLNRLNDRRTVLIGGNHEAERKALELLGCGARITLIHPVLTRRLKELAETGRITWIPREYLPGDLEGAFLVIVAQFSGDQNRQIFEEAEERGILVNVMDDIPHCTFTFGSIVKRGALTLAISTSGAAPALAVRLRQRFEKEFGDEFEPFLELMQSLRAPMAATWPDFETRRKVWYRLIDSDILKLFRENRLEEALALTEEIVGPEVLRQAI